MAILMVILRDGNVLKMADVGNEISSIFCVVCIKLVFISSSLNNC